MKHLYLTLAAAACAMGLYAQQDVTATYITNPSFEDGMTGWTNSGMQTQTNTYFSIKEGRTFAEAWVNRGSTLSDCSVSQTLKAVPAGKYRLSAASLHIQQAQANSTDNSGDPQTGASIFAGAYSTPINDMATRQFDFVALGGDLTIGMRAENATGNWVCVDNFQLTYLGEATNADLAGALQAQVDNIEANVLTQHMQNAPRTAMESALAEAKTLIGKASSMASAEYATAINAMLATLDERLEACNASIALYDKFEMRLAHAAKVLEWVKDDATKVATLQAAIDAANKKYTDYSLTDAQINEAIEALNAAIRSVDKGIYVAQWSLGDVNNPDNDWYIGRTVESQDWILFWQKGYGDEIPVNFRCGSYNVNAWETLEHAQTAFSFYADELKFINRATSKTNQYKMVIKLRYSESEWEATGSGVDDQIGLLTLTPWAQTSRNWQTLYHEVGHCFQYQVHCDNEDQNGWMYPIGTNGCAFWEQCAQWQAYKIMPYDQFTNEWYTDYLKNVHKHILHESPRYCNYMVMDYWTMLHGWDFMGRLWNESVKPEDAVEAYQRITNITNDEFNDQMWDCAARFATWDIPHFAEYHKDAWKKRQQPAFDLDQDNYWVVSADNAPENTGHNIIQLNAPAQACKVSAAFEGLAGDDRYRPYYQKWAGWRYGFVALLKDGTRVYGEPGNKASYSEPAETISFECPDDCERLWLVVSGASIKYRQHGWDDTDNNDEQYGYRVMFDNTNLIGQANNSFGGLSNVSADLQPAAKAGVYTLTGIQVRPANDLTGLPSGIYIMAGKKVYVK